MKMVITKAKAFPYSMEDRQTKRTVSGTACFVWGFKCALDTQAVRETGQIAAFGLEGKAMKVRDPELGEQLLKALVEANGVPLVIDGDADVAERGDGSGAKKSVVELAGAEILGLLGRDFTFSNVGVVRRPPAAQAAAPAAK